MLHAPFVHLHVHTYYSLLDGATASREYFRVTFTENNGDKAKIRGLMEEYCGLDTLGMVEIVESLRKHTRAGIKNN